MHRLFITAFVVCFLFASCDPVDSEDTSGYNCTPEGCFSDLANAQYLSLEDCLSVCDEDNNNGGSSQNNGDWSFSISLNGNLYSASGNQTTFCDQTNGYGWIGYGDLYIHLSSLDPTSTCHDSGGYITLTISCENPFIGINTCQLSGDNDFIDYFLPYYIDPLDIDFSSSLWMYQGLLNTYTTSPTTMSELGYQVGGVEGFGWVNPDNVLDTYTPPGFQFDFTSLGTLEVDNGIYSGQNIEGSYASTIYFMDMSNLGDNPTYEELNNAPFDIPLEIEINFSVTRTQ